jgi:hypothetical protein
MSDLWSVYNTTNGVFQTMQVHGQESDALTHLAAFQNPLLALWRGDVDVQRQKVDLDTYALVPYTPPKPEDSLYVAYVFDEARQEWVPTRTLAARIRDAKDERNRRISESVGRQLQAYRTGVNVQEIDLYLALLTTVDTQAGFPDNISWPVPPWL